MSDSRLSVRSSSGSVHGGGRIIAQNPSLLDMLREKTFEKEQETSEENVKRFYVESPVFTREDEENIQFVNPDVEEELQDSLDEKEPDSVSEMPTINDLVSKTADLKSRQNTNTTQFNDSRYGVNNKFDSSRYEDDVTEPDMSRQAPTKKLTSGQEKTWNTLQKGYNKGHDKGDGDNAVKSVNFQNSPTEIPANYNPNKMTSDLSKSEARIITPIQNPLQPMSKEQTEEMKLLEEEERYQSQLKQRIWDTANQAESVHIPKLDLDEVISDDDDQKRAKKGMVADSLESTDRSIKPNEEYRDSIEYPSQQQYGNDPHELQLKYQELQQRLERLETEKAGAPQLEYPQSQNDQRLQHMFESHRSDQASAKRMTSNDLKNLQDPRIQTQYSHEYDYVPEDHAKFNPNTQSAYRGQMPLNFASEANPPVVPEPEQNSHQNYPNEPYENERYFYRNGTQEDEQNYYAENPQYDLLGAPNQQYTYNQPYQQDQFGYESNYNEQDQNMEGYRNVPKTEESKDYIDLNKRAIRGDLGSAKSYGKMFHKKKDLESAPLPKPPARKREKKAGKPLITSTPAHSRISTSTNQGPLSNTRLPTTVEENEEDGYHHTKTDDEVSAEDRWAQRAQVLAKEKSKKLSAKSNESNTATLRKYPSASKVEEMKQQDIRQSNSRPVPHSLQNSAVQRQWQPANLPPSQQQNRYSNPQSPSKQTFHANPVKSETYTVVNEGSNGSHPVSRHAVYTDNGQKLDVDINVKMVSPQPHGSTMPASRQVNSMQQQRPPQGGTALYNQYGAESPMQLQSVTSSASTVRHVPPEQPNNMQYGYHTPSQNNQHYNYATHPQQYAPQMPAPPRDGTYPIQPSPQKYINDTYRVQGMHNTGPHEQPLSERGGTYPVHNSQFVPSQPHGAPIPGSEVRQNQPNYPFTRSRPQHSYQPVKAFDNYQESYDNYNDTYTLQDSYSGVTSPVSVNAYDKSSPTPGSMSPYRVVPPISSAEKEGRKLPFTQYGPPSKTTKAASSSPRHQNETEIYNETEGGGGSYMDTFEKNKNKKKEVNYKPYTLHDYRNMKKEVRLGGLGPDSDSETVREKREKLQRKLNYAKSINERNREEYEVAKTRPKANMTFTRDDEDSEQDMIDKRRLALEYAKSVPKPRVRTGTGEDDDMIQGHGSADIYYRKHKYVPGSHTNSMKTMTTVRAYPRNPGNSHNSHGGTVDGHSSPSMRQVSANTERNNEMIDLEALQQRHEQERQKVAMIKQNMQVS